jgi:multisubunit Na+/H+ antiporter MnhF subunit
MLFATTAATAVTMLVYRLVTPKDWSKRVLFSNRAKVTDALIMFSMWALWGFLAYLFLQPWIPD